jgi:nucleotide-binding universal stress UspA family protein
MVPMTARLIPRDARRALVVASRDAQLVVVGCHGPYGVRLVSQYVLHHAACPVAVVHDRGARPGTTTASAS